MHYYKRNIGDYHKKAGRLSMLEHGAYTLLIDACYDRERFPTEADAIDWCWARSDEEIAAVQFVLGKFFDLDGGVYVQTRISEEIDAYKGMAIKNKEIAENREKAKREGRNGSSTKRAPVVNESPPNQEPLTTNQEPIKKPSRSAKAVAGDSFDSFWKLYPKKVSKKDALKAWAKIEPDKHPEIMQGLANHRASQGWVKDDGQFIPNAATWLNAERWEDEVRPHVAGQSNTGGNSTGKPSLSEQVRQRNAERQAKRDREAGQSAQGSAELFTAGVDDYGRDFEGEFSRINDLDGKIVVADDRPVWAQVD
jgi:uncharacterized protein YdaU (DUF1376 family)